MQFNEPNPLAFSKLGLAAHIGDTDAIVKLLSQRHRVNLTDNRGWTPIHEAAANNKHECLKLLLKGKGKQYVNQRTMEGETPLLLACLRSASCCVIQLLINKGADVNLGNYENCTPLHEVCRRGNLVAAQTLVNAGGYINSLDFNLSTPLHLAVSSGCVELVEFLLSKEADVNLSDECDCTPLCLACSSGTWEITKLILQRHPNVNARTNDGATPLMLASQSASLNIINELLSDGADPDLAAEDHTLAIHQAAHSGDNSVLRRLLDVTSKQAISEHCCHEQAEHPNLLCLAMDSESLDCVRTLLDSDIDSAIHHLPVAQVKGLEDFKKRGFFSKIHPISFLFVHKMDTLENETLTFLDLLLSKGISVNTEDTFCLPPLAAACLVKYNSPVVYQCMEKLLAHGADTEHRTYLPKAPYCLPRVPSALLYAGITANWEALHLLLRSGSSGSPEMVLQWLISRTHYLSIPSARRAKLLSGIFRLGVTDTALQLALSTTFKTSIWQECEEYDVISTFIAGPPISSLQQLCRATVRHHLRAGNVKPLLEHLNLPEIIKCYLLYYT